MEQKPIILITSLRIPSPKGGSFSTVSVDASYLDVLKACRAVPLVVPLGLSRDELELLADKTQGLFIPGGVDINPKRYDAVAIHESVSDISEERDELEIMLAQIFIEKRKPIFGVCRGSQIINVAMGGTLYQDIQSEIQTDIHHEYNKEISLAEYFPKEIHEVIIAENTALASFLPLSKITVNSLHHQAVKDIAPGLLVCARAEDGVAEAIESEDMVSRWILGVQWHPEMLIVQHPENKILFEKFIEAARG
ncbi:MAG: gamma-glutamyl-gamma-aminobutyrate hydrolase family protein [Candidatus Parcubacteria bacterium]|nr:gamma-glutamyl-gamma-aminobutyrate hydrolase family protein [Candidatus Parcubacteria bacterium]